MGRTHAQDISPVILVLDMSSSEAARQTHHTAVSKAVDDAVSFIAAYNPVSIITTCSTVTGTQTPTQDAAALRAALAALPVCDTFDQAQALQQAAVQMGTQAGDVLYIIDGQNLTEDNTTVSTEAMRASLVQLRTQNICLYVIPIGDASLPTNAPDAIDRDIVQDLINAVNCGKRYTAQKTPTLTSTLLKAYLASQGRDLMTETGEQISLFERSTAKMKQAISEGVHKVRVDVIWGKGDVKVALQPPSGASADPTIISGDGYQSLTVPNPASGDWTVVLSVVDVPDNQVAVILFSQGDDIVAPVSETITEVATAESMVEATPQVTDSQTTVEASAVLTAEATSEPSVIASTPPKSTDSTLVPVTIAAGIGLIVIIGLGRLLFRRQPNRGQTESIPDLIPSHTLHSKTTSELPPVDSNVAASPRATQPTLPAAPPNRLAPPSLPADTQFRQFPATLVFVGGSQRGQAVEIDSGYFTIGRHSSSRLRIQDVAVSREHARIIFDNAQNLYLIENTSKAGTRVNGQYITQPQPIYNGDLIQVGTIQMQFQLRLTT